MRHVVVDFMRPISFMDPAPLEVQPEMCISNLRPVAHVVRLVQDGEPGAFAGRPVLEAERVHARRDPDQRVGRAPVGRPLERRVRIEALVDQLVEAPALRRMTRHDPDLPRLSNL